MKIENLELSVRAFNVLKRKGIDNTSQILDLSINDLKKIPNCGIRTVKEILTKTLAKLEEENYIEFCEEFINFINNRQNKYTYSLLEEIGNGEPKAYILDVANKTSDKGVQYTFTSIEKLDTFLQATYNVYALEEQMQLNEDYEEGEEEINEMLEEIIEEL